MPQFYTCGAEGFWRPNPNGPSGEVPFVYPACSKAKPAQKIFKIKLDYLTDVLCNDAGKVSFAYLVLIILSKVSLQYARFDTISILKISRNSFDYLKLIICRKYTWQAIFGKKMKLTLALSYQLDY